MSKTSIMGKAVATAEQMANYVLSVNPSPKLSMPAMHLARLYLLVGDIEGVRGDLEFARSCHETGNFAFRGTVTPDQKNFCGHGTVSATVKGSYFPDEFYGIMAQIQHAKAYASTEPLNYECVDDRYKYVTLGCAPTMEETSGRWAVPGYETGKYSSLQEAIDAEDSYGHKIVKILNKILAMPTEMVEEKEEENVPEVPELPKQNENAKPLAGKKICEDAGHFGKYNRSPGVAAYYESDMTWKLHLLRKKYLEELGAEVITTRPNKDVDLAVTARGMAGRGCDLVISDHSNAVANGMNEDIDYVAVYHLTEDAFAVCDEISAEIARVLAPAIASVMNPKQGYKVLTRLASTDRNKDGVMNDNYYGFLHGARSVDVPGLILEHSFHTNTAMTLWLMDDDNLDKLAKAEAEAIAEYFSKQSEDVPDNSSVPYMIRVANVLMGDVLYIRKEPKSYAKKTGELAYNDPNKYTIVEERDGWGKLKSGIGWINLRYTKRV